MTNKLDLKLFSVLVIAGVFTSLLVLPFTFALISLPADAPLALIVVAQTVQVAILLSLACFVGLRLLPKTGLAGFPLLQPCLHRQKPAVRLRPLFLEAILWGLLGGALTVLLCIPFWGVSVEMLTDEMKVAVWRSALACFYGGVGEELLFRLGMMTFLVRLLDKCRLRRLACPLAILITGVIFGLGHIGITSSLTAITAPIILRAVLLNGSLSIIYGILYQKRGLESAMLAHFSTDVVLHILIPHVIAPFFI